MEQKDIDRLLICRAAVDKQREFNKARVEAYTTCKSVTEAKTLIESKTGVATTISMDSAVKTADAIKSTLEAERTKMTIAMYDVIKGQGFTDFQEFKDWHDKVVFEVYKECHPIQGSCDLCGQKGLEKQPCVVFYKSTDVCPKVGEPASDGVYQDAFWREKNGAFKTVGDMRYGNCLDGHGFWQDMTKFKEPPFDLLWSV
jgi:hypothetical protein